MTALPGLTQAGAPEIVLTCYLAAKNPATPVTVPLLPVIRSRSPSTTRLSDLPANQLSRVVSKQLSLLPVSSTWLTLSFILMEMLTSQDLQEITLSPANTAPLNVTGT